MHCCTCNKPVGSPAYAAGNGSGEQYECSGCHWRRKFDELHEAVIPIMHWAGWIRGGPIAALRQEMMSSLLKDLIKRVPEITGKEYEEYT